MARRDLYVEGRSGQLERGWYGEREHGRGRDMPYQDGKGGGAEPGREEGRDGMRSRDPLLVVNIHKDVEGGRGAHGGRRGGETVQQKPHVPYHECTSSDSDLEADQLKVS